MRRKIVSLRTGNKCGEGGYVTFARRLMASEMTDSTGSECAEKGTGEVNLYMCGGAPSITVFHQSSDQLGFRV